MKQAGGLLESFPSEGNELKNGTEMGKVLAC